MYGKKNEIPEKIFIKKYLLVNLKVPQGRGKENTEICELYRVIPFF